MKIIFNIFSKKGLALCLLMLSSLGFAQTFNISLANATQTSTTTFEVDVMISVLTPTNGVRLASVSCGINFNSGILNGGTPCTANNCGSWSKVPDTTASELSNLLNPTLAMRIVSPTIVRITMINQAGSLAADVPVGTYRVGRYKFTNTVAFTSSSNANLWLQNVVQGGNQNSIVGWFAAGTSTPIGNATTLSSGSNGTITSLSHSLASPLSLILNAPTNICATSAAVSNLVNVTPCSGALNGSATVTLSPAPTSATAMYSVDGGTPQAATLVDGSFTVTGLSEGNHTVAVTPAECTEVTTESFAIGGTPLQTPTVALTSSDGDNTFALGTSVTFTATASNVVGNTGITYDFKVNGVSKQNNASNTFTTTNLFDQQQVSVSIAVTGGDCLASNTADSASITNTVTGGVLVYISTYCGQTLPGLAATIYSTTAVVSGTPTVQYQFRVKKVGGAEETLALRNTPSFNLTQSSLYAYNSSYQVYVSAVINGVVQPESPACLINTPTTVPAPVLQTTYCNNTLATAYTPVFAVPVSGATGYSFVVRNAADTVTLATFTGPNNYFYITQLASWTYNTMYKVYTSVKINQEAYGPQSVLPCEVTTPELTTPGLIACGGSVTSAASPVFTSTVSGATNYSFEVSGSGIATTIIDRSVPYFYLTNIAGWNYNTVYTVKVTVTKGSEVGPQSSGCTLTTPAIPSTKVKASQCGQILATASTPIFVDAVYGATMYQYTIVGLNTNYTFESPLNYFSMTSVSTWEYENEYTVSVQASRNGGGYSPVITTCTVTTPAGPKTTGGALCSNPTLSRTTGILSCNAYSNATAYEFLLESYTEEGDFIASTSRVSPNNSIMLSLFNGSIPGELVLEDGITYRWGVRIKVLGKFGNYTKGCSFTTSVARVVDQTKIVMPFSAIAYPNPFANNFMLDVKTSSQSLINVKVYDMVGRLIEQRDVRVSDMETTTIGDRYPSGVYNVVVSQEGSVQTVRVIKR